MPTFRVVTKEGKTYRVEAPDAQSADETVAEMLVAQQPQEGGWDRAKEDVAQTASGLGEGVLGLAGTPGDIREGAASGTGWVAGKFGASPETQQYLGNAMRGAFNMLPGGANMPTTAQLQQGAEAVGVPFAGEAQYPEGKYLRTGGQMIPGATLGPGSLASKALTTGAAAIGSERAGQWAQKNAPDWEGVARTGGSLIGGLTPSLVRRGISPLPISSERQQMVSALKKEGVDLTAGQATGRKGLQYAESELGGHRATDMMERQGEQFTGAALKRVGEKAARADPATVDRAFTRIGKQFNDLAARNTLIPDRQMMGDLIAAKREYNSVVNASARAPIVENTVRDIVNTASQGGIRGKAYQALRSRLGKAAQSARNDPQLSGALKDIQGALDDAMERTLAKNGSPDFGAWQEARNQYRNMLVIERAATGAGENAAQGLISPSALRNATVGQSRRSYARGKGDFAELARAGEATMKPLPNSGTAPRTAVRNVIGGTATLAGGLLGGVHGGDIQTTLIGLMAGAAVPSAISRALLSRPGQAYLKNQLVTKLPTNPRLAAIIAALMANQPKRTLEGSIGGGDIPQSRGGWGQ